MAIDTRAKRQQALNVSGKNRVLPYRDGSVDQADRQHLLGFYGGIAAGEAVTWTEQTVGSATWTEQTLGSATWTEQTVS